MNTNSLINENSPYLLQHANNPVNWFSWNDAVLSKAKEENKPIFLSIGYSACHWCHVMERESFSDEKVAAILNRGFVSIKVDREERPDIDSLYMDFCQKMTGSGGWPLTVIMTPACKPFFVGTYLPKNSSFGRTGLTELLTAVENGWIKNKEAFEGSAENMLSNMSGLDKEPRSGDLINKTYEYLNNAFDPKYGGFGVPKFPMPSQLKFLIEYYKKYGDNNALNMLNTTLISMYKGGIFDHIGYGFFRYSTDEKWLIPHFEKMLYDNALLIDVYYSAYQATKNELYKKIADDCILYLLREMKDPKGGFYSSQDADSEGTEGAYYLFDINELNNILGENDGLAFIKKFGITRKGNFEGKNIPNMLANEKVDEDYDFIINKVYLYRKNRHSLLTDDKIITSWNCLLISALSTAYKYSFNKDYLSAAKNAFDFIIGNLAEGKNFYTFFRKGKKSANGFLDDYAALIYACISLYGATLDSSYLDKAEFFLEETVKEFFDNEKGGFYLNKKSENNLIRRPKEYYDGVTPSGNSLMYYNLFFLSEIQRLKPYYQEVFAKLKKYLDDTFTPGGQSFYAYSSIIEKNFSKIVAVIKAGEEKNLAKNQILGYDIIKVTNPTDDYPLKNDKTTFYICKNNSCLPPTNMLT